MTKLSVAIMIKNEIEFIECCYNSIKNVADEIIIVIDDKSTDGTIEFVKELLKTDDKIKLHIETWRGGAKQKQFLKEQCTEDWILFLDGDEVLSDNAEVPLKKLIEHPYVIDDNGTKHNFNYYNIRSHHFIYGFGAEDVTVPKHFHEARLIKNDSKFNFVGHNHAMVKGHENLHGLSISNLRIYHYGSCKNMDRIRHKLKKDLRIDQFNRKEYTRSWAKFNYTLKYPVKHYSLNDHPNTVKEKYMFDEIINSGPDLTPQDKDRYYETIQQRNNIEEKHKVMVKEWLDHFEKLDYKINSVLDIGCSRGAYINEFKNSYIQNVIGIEIDKDVIANAHSGVKDHIEECNLLDLKGTRKFDLILCSDILEHIDYEDLGKALENVKHACKQYCIFSIPFLGDPNLHGDMTHKIFETKEWWIKKLQSVGFIVNESPKHWMFNNQILIGELNNGNSK